MTTREVSFADRAHAFELFKNGPNDFGVPLREIRGETIAVIQGFRRTYFIEYEPEHKNAFSVCFNYNNDALDAYPYSLACIRRYFRCRYPSLGTALSMIASLEKGMPRDNTDACRQPRTGS